MTLGEPAGIGPDLCLLGVGRDNLGNMLVIGDAELLRARAQALRTLVNIRRHSEAAELPSTRAPGLDVIDVPLPVAVVAGQPDPRNAATVLGWIDRAVAGCLSGRFAAMVTGPVDKAVINRAGIPFSGHTEYVARLSGCPDGVMMLVGGDLRVALVTTHIPLHAVPGHITVARLDRTIRIVDADLRRRFGLRAPRIAVCGLNPHAGEQGYLGSEEISVITPTIQSLVREGLVVFGPLAADSAFTDAALSRCDVVVCMYHDQGLPVLKQRSFHEGVNLTLGLPLVRTSVDHGTAYDLAGTGRADPCSLLAALQLATELATGTSNG